MEAVLASSSPGKALEVRAILDGSGLDVVIEDLWLGDLENGVDYLENARLKAIAALRLLRRPVLAEDSGLEVDAIGGLPGLRSARFSAPGATDERNNGKLLRLLEAIDPAHRTARYRAVAVLLLPTGAEVTGDGTWEGAIASTARGSGGFGYDPLFVPDGERRTAAELSPDEKNEVSHRAQALLALVEKARVMGLLA